MPRPRRARPLCRGTLLLRVSRPPFLFSSHAPIHNPSTYLPRLPAASCYPSPFPYTPAAFFCCFADRVLLGHFSVLSDHRRDYPHSPNPASTTCDKLAAACMDQVRNWVEIRVLNPRSPYSSHKPLNFREPLPLALHWPDN